MTAPIRNPALNVIALLRVSTDTQDVARQRADMTKLEVKFHLSLDRTLELVGVSGTATLDNEQVQQVLADLERPEIDGIAVSSLDRLFRPKRYGHFGILDRFCDEHKKIWSAREGEVDPSTDEGYDKCISAGGRAGAEWRELRRRTADGRQERLKEGKLDHGSACYGYVYIDKRQQNGARLDIDPAMSSVPGLSRVQVVKDVYAWRKANIPTYSIVKRLNAAGIRSAGYNGKPGGLWSRQVVLQMLKNTTYIGQHVRAGVVIPCPAIIGRETFDAVQRVTEESRQKNTGRPSNRYLLRGLLWCAKCTRRCITNPGVKKSGKPCPIYLCGNIEYKPYKRRCHAPQVPVAIIENVVWNAIWGLLKHPALLLQLARAYYEAMGTPEGDSTAALERERERLAMKIATTRDMIQDNLIAYAKGKADIRACEERIRQIEAELAAAGRVVSLPPLRAAEAAMREITSGPEPKTYERRRSILEGILDLRITYFDGDLEIEGKVPVPGAADASTGSREKKCNRGLGPDSQGERQDRHGTESLVGGNRAQAVAHVLRKLFRECPGPCRARVLLY
jgi:DNA invertase Pin-like site-specific DNA recombinase